MAYSQVVIPGDGFTTLLNVGLALGYINKDHVRVYVEGEVDGAGDIVYRAFSFTTPNLLQVVGSAAPVGNNYVVQRSVPKDSLIVDWENGDPLNAENLNKSQKQLAMMAHEALDGRIDINKSLDFKNLFTVYNLPEPVNPGDAVPKMAFDRLYDLLAGLDLEDVEETGLVDGGFYEPPGPGLGPSVDGGGF